MAERQTGEIRMRVQLGDGGKDHDEATCDVKGHSMADSDEESGFVKATSVYLIIKDPYAQKNYPIRIVLDADSATRLAADILDLIAPRAPSLWPRPARFYSRE
jgi:hypothetical protein